MAIRGVTRPHLLRLNRQVVLDHHVDQLIERDRRLPGQHITRLRRVADEGIDICRTEEAVVYDDELLAIRDPGRSEGKLG